MHDQVPTPDPDRARIEAELIERIYKVAISPHAYDDFMEKWADYVEKALDDLTALKKEVELEETVPLDTLSRHFDMGFRLLEELGRSDPSGERSGTGHGSAGASVLVDRSGQIVWYNGAASRYFDLRRLSRIDELPFWDRSREELTKLIARLETETDPTCGQTVLRIHSPPADKTLFMLTQRVENGDGEALIILNQVIASWHEAVGTMLSASFGLSTAEVQIAQCLIEGANVAEIAKRRSSAISTVRTQIKTLLSKTGVSSQTDLIRLLMSLNEAAGSLRDPQSHVRRGQTFRFRQRDDRLVPFHRFGPPKGRPFIMFHGMLDGCDLNDATVDLLHEYDVCLHAPERPFFGSAAGVKGEVKDAPNLVARDVEDLLDHLGLEAVGLVGHMAGAVYAFAAAAHLGARVRSITSVSGGVPIRSIEQFATMSPRQRLVAYTAKYTPKLLPFLLRAGIRQLDFGGEENFMRSLYETSPTDLEILSDGETARIIAAGYQFSIAQGHRAFEIDSYQVVRDWSERVDQSQVPVTLIHGRHDPVVSIASVEEFAARLGQRARLIVEEETGQLLLYRTPETVVATLAASA